MAEALDVVILTRDRPDLGLKKGERGTVVLKLTDTAFLVEFANENGVEYAMPTLTAEEIEVVWRLGDPPLEARPRGGAI